ncbi:hypothetical protein ACH42_06655 [Endozoicomonas sp. (ex Bugula neritina AB1)]|nr:hypothetical protein ACH42_06655 [Endozoicomonas sp. (ex Bugula neritina AB1)]
MKRKFKFFLSSILIILISTSSSSYTHSAESARFTATETTTEVKITDAGGTSFTAKHTLTKTPLEIDTEFAQFDKEEEAPDQYISTFVPTRSTSSNFSPISLNLLTKLKSSISFQIQGHEVSGIISVHGLGEKIKFPFFLDLRNIDSSLTSKSREKKAEIISLLIVTQPYLLQQIEAMLEYEHLLNHKEPLSETFYSHGLFSKLKSMKNEFSLYWHSDPKGLYKIKPTPLAIPQHLKSDIDSSNIIGIDTGDYYAMLFNDTPTSDTPEIFISDQLSNRDRWIKEGYAKVHKNSNTIELSIHAKQFFYYLNMHFSLRNGNTADTGIIETSAGLCIHTMEFYDHMNQVNKRHHLDALWEGDSNYVEEFGELAHMGHSIYEVHEAYTDKKYTHLDFAASIFAATTTMMNFLEGYIPDRANNLEIFCTALKKDNCVSTE